MSSGFTSKECVCACYGVANGGRPSITSQIEHEGTLNMSLQPSRKLIVGNWKMHGGRDRHHHLLSTLKARLGERPAHVDVAVCVPFPYLGQVQATLEASSIGWGTQDISARTDGAFTGEVSASMAVEFGARYAIVGHSERRLYHGETCEAVAQKARQALEGGLIPIVCLGETLEERRAGHTMLVLTLQLNVLLDTLTLDELRHVVIAYEPVWAIGTGASARPEDVCEVHRHLRASLKACDPSLEHVTLLYGGSVGAANAPGLFEQPNVDGALVGGASLDPDAFIAVCQAGGWPIRVADEAGV